MNALARVGFALAVLFIAAYALLPFVYAISSSLKSGSALFDPSLWPAAPSGQNYRAVFGEQAFATSLLNSILVATVVVGLSVALGLSTAYGLARHAFRGRATVMMTLLAVSMFPQIAVLSGMFALIRGLGLYNSLASLMLSYLILTLPFTVWVLTTFVRAVPVEIEDAAKIDGAGPATLLIRILLPLMAPAMVSTGLLAFIAAWNEFLFALTFTLTNDQRTVPVAIALMSGASSHELPWGQLMAASVIVTVPLILLVMLFQRRIVAGLTAGAVRG